MHLINLTCKYCDHKWRLQVYSKKDVESLECSVCKDRHITAKEDVAKIDYYEGSPPFINQWLPEDDEHYFY